MISMNVLDFYVYLVFFLFIDPATTESYTDCHTLSLHDALPIWPMQPITPGLNAMRAMFAAPLRFPPKHAPIWRACRKARPRRWCAATGRDRRSRDGRRLACSLARFGRLPRRRTEERRVGQGGVSTGKSRWAPVD